MNELQQENINKNQLVKNKKIQNNEKDKYGLTENVRIKNLEESQKFQRKESDKSKNSSPQQVYPYSLPLNATYSSPAINHSVFQHVNTSGTKFSTPEKNKILDNVKSESQVNNYRPLPLVLSLMSPVFTKSKMLDDSFITTEFSDERNSNKSIKHSSVVVGNETNDSNRRNPNSQINLLKITQKKVVISPTDPLEYGNWTDKSVKLGYFGDAKHSDTGRSGSRSGRSTSRYG
jgi:hypothetical protein